MFDGQIENNLYVGIVTSGREEIKLTMEGLERQTKEPCDVIVLQNKPQNNDLRKYVESLGYKWAAENGKSIGYARTVVVRILQKIDINSVS